MDCLVTKLKGVVNNDNLEKLGSVTLVVDKWHFPNAVPSLRLQANGACKVILPEGEYITTSDGITPLDGVRSRTYNLAASDTFTIVNLSYAQGKPYTVTITNAASLVMLKPGTYNVNVYMDANTIKYNYCKNLTTLGYTPWCNIVATENTNVTDLFSSTKLTGVELGGNNGENSFGGNLEDCAVKLWNMNKRSGTITVDLGSNNNLSFHGSTMKVTYPNTAVDVKFVYSANGINVSANNVSVGSYDGTSWTYV